MHGPFLSARWEGPTPAVPGVRLLRGTGPYAPGLPHRNRCENGVRFLTRSPSWDDVPTLSTRSGFGLERSCFLRLHLQYAADHVGHAVPILGFNGEPLASGRSQAVKPGFTLVFRFAPLAC